MSAEKTSAFGFLSELGIRRRTYLAADSGFPWIG